MGGCQALHEVSAATVSFACRCEHCHRCICALRLAPSQGTSVPRDGLGTWLHTSTKQCCLPGAMLANVWLLDHVLLSYVWTSCRHNTGSVLLWDSEHMPPFSGSEEFGTWVRPHEIGCKLVQGLADVVGMVRSLSCNGKLSIRLTEQLISSRERADWSSGDHVHIACHCLPSLPCSVYLASVGSSSLILYSAEQNIHLCPLFPLPGLSFMI